jgi:hypothetical protein
MSDGLPYQLATELKDAGFPQGGSGNWVGDPDAVVMRSGDRVYAPTLSELIEACGDQFLTLRRSNDVWEGIGGVNDGTHSRYQQQGASPDEAVARLWLALTRSQS